MRTLFTTTVISLSLAFLPTLIFSQTLALGVLSSFEGYTGAGSISHTGALWTGDVGTNTGIITGTYTGTTYNTDAVTAQSRYDLMRLYIQLNDLFVDYPGTHTAFFGGGETIIPGVYSIPSAGSIGGALTLDGGGDPNAFFILKFNGAITVPTGTVVTLSGGTQSCNVFWIAEGAITIAASSNIKGTLFSHLAAIDLGANTILEGRMFTMAGAITTGAGVMVGPPSSFSSIQVVCGIVCTPTPAVDVLGSVSNFAIFTNSGAVANIAISGLLGDIGTDAGTISGFSSHIHVGNEHTVDAITVQAKIDLDLAYLALMALPNTVTTHTATFGLGETLSPGVYSVAGAGSLGGTITLDGGGNPDAIFVFKFGGAFSIAAASKVILANRAQYCNVFWIGGAGVVTGAITIGASSVMKGIFISHDGACSAGAGGFIQGRMLSTTGAVNTNSSIIYTTSPCITSSLSVILLPIELVSFTAAVKDASIELNWATTAEINNDYFNIERSDDGINFTSIDKINGARNSIQNLSYSTVDHTPLEGWSYYRLKQTDYNEKINYSDVVAVEFNTMNDFVFRVYPNPFSAETTFRTTENLKNATLTVYDSYGHIVKQIKNISGQTITLHRDNVPSGVYFSRLVQNNTLIATRKLVITD
jgi:hypothetical protein